MDGPRDCRTERKKSDRESQISDDIDYMWNVKKMTQMSLFTKQIESQMKKTTNLMVMGGKGEGTNWEIGIDIYSLLYIKWIIRSYHTAQVTLLNSLQ